MPFPLFPSTSKDIILLLLVHFPGHPFIHAPSLPGLEVCCKYSVGNILVCEATLSEDFL